MAPDGEDESPAPETLCGALDDPDATQLLRHLDEPRTAQELAERCDIPISTVYRKINRLDEASLVRTRTDVRADGHHTTTYEWNFERITLTLDEDGRIQAAIDRPDRPPAREARRLQTAPRS